MQSNSASGTINLSNQRISFVNKINLILKATSDDESITPGYLYKEINDISHESVGYSESLVEFLTDRLKSNSYHVKYKVLRLIKHLIENGSREFKLGIRRHASAIQECTKFGGPPHPMHGNTPYLMIRKTASEVCEDLYSMVPEGMRSPADVTTSDKTPELKYGGLGPVRTGGSIQGFGNTPANHSKSIGETIMGGLEKLSAKMTETPSTRQAALLANLDMSGSTRNYQPPSLPLSLYPGSSHGDSPTNAGEANSASVGATKKSAKKPTPGRAGGGWGDDDEEEEDVDGEEGEYQSMHGFSTKHSSPDADLEKQPQTDMKKSNEAEHQAEWTPEYELLTETLATGSTGPGRELLAPSDVAAFIDKAAKMCCPLLVELLAQKLSKANCGLTLRALQLLEGIIYNNEELVPINHITSICQRYLVDCFTTTQNSIGESKLNQRTDQTDAVTFNKGVDKESKSSEESSLLINTLHAKSAKLILSLQQLSPVTDILSANSFNCFLPVN